MAIDVTEVGAQSALCKECTPNSGLGRAVVQDTSPGLIATDLYEMLGIKTELSQEQYALLKKIVDWNGWNDVQIGVRKEYRMSATQFNTVVIEYWKFLALIPLSSSGVGMFSRQVDKIWHSHILNMPSYTSFCMEIFGYVLCHIPNLEKKPSRKQIQR